MDLFISLISAIGIFLIEELFRLFVLIPASKDIEIKSQIISTIVMYRGYLTSPQKSENRSEKWDAGSDEFRKAASYLFGIVNNSNLIERIIAKYPLRKSVLEDCAHKMIGLSNSFYDADTKDNQATIKEVQKILKIKNY